MPPKFEFPISPTPPEYTMENQRLFSNRQKRERLKEEFEHRKLAKRLILNGYFFSLHDLRRYKLAFRCCRKASKKCRIRIYISWEELEKAGHYVQGGVRIAPEIKGKIDYDLRGQHSKSCIAQNVYRKQATNCNGLMNLGTAATESGFLVSQIEKNLRMTLDGGMVFCLGRSDVMECSFKRKGSILLLGSEYSINCLIKCRVVFVFEHKVKLRKNNKKINMISIIGEYEEGYCVPGAHVILELRGTKSVRESMRMLQREVQKCVDNEVKSLDEKFPKWEKVVVYSDKLVAREVARNLKHDVDLGFYDEDWEIQKKIIDLSLDKMEQVDILIPLLKTLRKVGQSKGGDLYKRLSEEVKKEKNPNFQKLINFFWNDELEQIKSRRSKCEETFPQSCKKYISLFRKEITKKRGNLEVVLNVLRYFELHFRQKLMEKNYKMREKMMRRTRGGRYLRRERGSEDAIEIESQDFIEEDSEDEEVDKRHVIDKIRGIDVFVNVI